MHHYLSPTPEPTTVTENYDGVVWHEDIFGPEIQPIISTMKFLLYLLVIVGSLFALQVGAVPEPDERMHHYPSPQPDAGK
ncbi:hypothetical protein quinque_015213 [Culex quinquefasciatus]